MKKFFKLLLFLITPLMVNADMGAPVIPAYQAIVNNPDGITVNDKTLKYGTKVTVNWEEYFDGLNKTICYIKDFGETKCSNLIPVDKEFNFNDALKNERIVKLKYKKTATILNPNGVDIYSGPSIIYKKIGKLSYNTKLTVEYVSGGDSGSDSSTITSAVWIYINDGTNKGWIYGLEKNLGYEPELKEAFLVEKVTIKDDNNKDLLNIPANTRVKVLYDTDDWSREYYIEYKEQKGFISKYSVAYKVNGIITINNDKELLSYANNEKKGVLEKLASNTTYKFTYAYGDYGENWYYVTTPSGKNGWIYTIDSIENDVNITYDEKEPIIEPAQEQTTTQINNDKETKNLSIENEIIVYILVATVIILSSVVIMLLINNKVSRKNK